MVVNDRAGGSQAEEVVATIAAASGEAVTIKADVTVPNDVTAMVDEIDSSHRPRHAGSLSLFFRKERAG